MWEAIRTCWASPWSDRAAHCLRAMDMSARKMKMALPVQELVEADASGVAFTKEDLFLHEFLSANCWEQSMHQGYGDFLLGGLGADQRALARLIPASRRRFASVP